MAIDGKIAVACLCRTMENPCFRTALVYGFLGFLKDMGCHISTHTHSVILWLRCWSTAERMWYQYQNALVMQEHRPQRTYTPMLCKKLIGTHAKALQMPFSERKHKNNRQGSGVASLPVLLPKEWKNRALFPKCYPKRKMLISFCFEKYKKPTIS